MSVGKPFVLYRIVCHITGLALVTGSNRNRWAYSPSRHAVEWHHRGTWSTKGAFWRTPESVKTHLYNLCCEWEYKSEYRYGGLPIEYHSWWYARTAEPDWSRLEFLGVEQTQVTEYTASMLGAKDFMGMREEVAPE